MTIRESKRVGTCPVPTAAPCDAACCMSYPQLSWDSRISRGKQPELGPAWCWELCFLFIACKLVMTPAFKWHEDTKNLFSHLLTPSMEN